MHEKRESVDHLQCSKAICRRLQGKMRSAYSNSISIWLVFTASRDDTLTDFTFPAIGAVTLVSIFMASSTTIRSLTPNCLTRFHIHPYHNSCDWAAAEFEFVNIRI